MNITHKLTEDNIEPNWVIYDQLHGLTIYVSYSGGNITHFKFVEAGIFRFIMPAYLLVGSLAVLCAKDRYSAAAIAFIFVGFLPVLRQKYKAFVINRLDAMAVRRDDDLALTIRVTAKYSLRL